MFLRDKFGFYAGTIREYPSDIGLELVRTGRAENPWAPPAPVVPDADLATGPADLLPAPRGDDGPLIVPKKKGRRK